MVRGAIPFFLTACAISGCSVSDPVSDPESAPSADASPPPQEAVTCAVPATESWAGTATRDNESGYPDHVHATVSWRRVSTAGCLDTYEPSGTVTYAYDIPGALCTQSLDPAQHAIGAADGVLTIDRSHAPATYEVHAATTWSMTHHCVMDDGHDESFVFTGGGTWADGTGTLDGDVIGGGVEVPDDAAKCGPQGIAPCRYDWHLGG